MGYFWAKKIGLNLCNVIKLQSVFLVLGICYNLLEKRVLAPGLQITQCLVLNKFLAREYLL